MEYYIVVNDRQQGPFTKEELRQNNISRDTLVWRSGMPDWVKASELPELADIFIIDVNATDTNQEATADNGWYAMINGNRVGPATVAELINNGLRLDTPVWHNGLHDWVPASTQVEIVQAFNDNRPPHFNSFGQQSFGQQPNFSQNPLYGNQQFSGNNQYNNPYNNQSYNNQPYNNSPLRTNWLPWAIVAAIVGFLFSCIGAIFGIIAIVQANKANDLYAAGYDEQGDSANNSAKIMTIIGLVLAGIGIVASMTILNGNLFERLL